MKSNNRFSETASLSGITLELVGVFGSESAVEKDSRNYLNSCCSLVVCKYELVRA